MEEWFGYLGAIVVVLAVIWFAVRSLRFQTRLLEGMTTTGDVTQTGEAGSATTYAAAIKAQCVKLQDELLISKYRADYENVILTMDDFISLSMLKHLLNTPMGGEGASEALVKLGQMQAAKSALNGILTYVDNSK